MTMKCMGIPGFVVSAAQVVPNFTILAMGDERLEVLVDYSLLITISNCCSQSWESYFIKVIYYILLFTFANSNVLQLHIT